MQSGIVWAADGQRVANERVAIGRVVEPRRTIYIDRCVAKASRKKPRGGQKVLSGGRKRVLVVLFVPSVERDGTTPIDQ